MTPIGVQQPAAAPASKLQALLGHYESEDEEQASGEDPVESEFKDFLKDIESTPVEAAAPATAPAADAVWQELWDPQSGQPYYWHTATNELTWEKPADLNPKPPVEASEKADVRVKEEVNHMWQKPV